MLFNSFEFVVFFAAFCAVFFALPRHRRGGFLLLASYVFYAGWRATFLLLLLATTLVDYVCARGIDGARTNRGRRAFMALSLGINLGLLCTYKYLDFFISNVLGLVGWFTGQDMPAYALELILPVGISFYTFQSVGYTLDVYFKRTPAERSLLHYAIYVAFFPQLVAGPIERAAHMIAQYKNMPPTTPQRLHSGLWLIGWGLFKKMCIADLIAPFVNGVYANPTAFNGSITLLATVLFAIQIYCDFSGYSDIAIGCARILGIDLMINFRQPYFALSLTDFWRRWHISLSTWLRDFVYQPLGGNRVPQRTWVRNTLVVFVVSGVWHGANWTFMIWGLIHGTALVAERLLGLVQRQSAEAAAAQPGWQALRLTTTLCIVIAAWVFFRSRSVPDALHVLGSWAQLGPLDYATFKALGLPSVEILIAVAHIVLLLVVDAMIAHRPRWALSFWARPGVALTLALMLFYDIMLLGVFGRMDFVYFQF